jgi:hypothetical protein
VFFFSLLTAEGYCAADTLTAVTDDGAVSTSEGSATAGDSLASLPDPDDVNELDDEPDSSNIAVSASSRQAECVLGGVMNPISASVSTHGRIMGTAFSIESRAKVRFMQTPSLLLRVSLLLLVHVLQVCPQGGRVPLSSLVNALKYVRRVHGRVGPPIRCMILFINCGRSRHFAS